MKLKLIFSLFQITVRWICRFYLPVKPHIELIQLWVRQVQNRALTRGTVETIGWVKATRLAFTRYLCRQPLSESPGFGVQLDTFGLPIGNPLVPLFTSRDSTLLRFGFTLLGISRLLPGWKAPDLSTITRPGPPIIPTLVGEVVRTVTALGWKLARPEWVECHVSTKAGPNAQAMVGSVEDAHLLTDQQMSDIAVLGGESVLGAIANARLFSPLAWLAKFKLTPKGRSARLSLVRDKEAKVRIVAILDYWSQSVLKPLHDSAMSFLKGLRSDCTFNQGSFRAKLAHKGPYHSLDLTAATDRFPVWLQVAVLSVLVAADYADAWRRLIIDRDYDVSWVRHTKQTVRYACGQPMGAYSSWAIFSICHHVIVRVAAQRAGKPVSFSNYVLLGDDIVIGDDAVAEHYRAIMSELGVEISVPKSHVSSDTYEFAKRWIHDGTEVTGAPLGSLFEAVRTRKVDDKSNVVPTSLIAHVSFYGVATWLRELEGRWLPRSETLVSRGLLADLFSSLGMAVRADRLAEKAWRFFLLPVRVDSRGLRKYKTNTLASILLGSALSCNSFLRAGTRVLILLNECKARVIEEAIKRQIGQFQKFQLELQRFADLVPEGLDAQSSLLSLPPIAALIRNVRYLQLEFDKAHLVRESDDIVQWLHLDVRLFLDPFAALSTRTSKTAAMSKATILNYLTSMCAGIGFLRDLSISDKLSLESLVHVVQNYEVLPKSGYRPRRKKGGSKVSK
jgi:hypothetical protein